MPGKADFEGGFTLVELLVALALLAMTATLLLATMTTGRGLQARVEASAVATESVAAAQNVLRARIEAIIPESYFLGATPTIDARGSDQSFAFTARPGLGRRPGPPQRYRILLTRAGELTLFNIDTLAIAADAPGLEGWTRSPLLGNVDRLAISYYGVHPPDNQRRWRAFWQDQPGLPELVRIRVAFAPGDRRVWPDLIIQPAANVTPTCQIDVVTGRCRTVVL